MFLGSFLCLFTIILVVVVVDFANDSLKSKINDITDNSKIKWYLGKQLKFIKTSVFVPMEKNEEKASFNKRTSFFLRFSQPFRN